MHVLPVRGGRARAVAVQKRRSQRAGAGWSAAVCTFLWAEHLECQATLQRPATRCQAQDRPTAGTADK
eukprot:357579-Chlamydomonas_euryale.AAC.7